MHIEDKEFPQIRTLLDPEAMVPAFQELFNREYPRQQFRVSRCEIARVYHHPSRKCHVTYRLYGEDGNGRPFDQWFIAKAFGNGRKKRKPKTDAPQEWPGCGAWHPISVWSEMGTTLYAFPYDKKLPLLGRLLQPEFVKQQIEARREAFGLAPEWHCESVTVHKVKYRAGKNCVLRYEADFRSPGGQSRRVEFYGKTYKDSRSRYVFDILQKICARSDCDSAALSIPQPIAHLDEANTLWQHAWPGGKLSQIGHEKGWDALLQTNIMARIGTMIARLHSIELAAEDLRDGPSPLQMLSNAKAEVHDIMQFLPDLRTDTERAKMALIRLAPGPETSLPHTTIHGTFKLAQILVRDDRLAMVDFDSVAYGDPVYDLAEFVASVVYLEVRDGVSRQHIEAGIERFLAAYDRRRFTKSNRQRLAWYVVIFLLGKIHASLKSRDAGEIGKIASSLDLICHWMQRADR